ncbi:MAG: DNA polymerase III subunit alpha [Candidatus Omnitrophica bacterium]|nr:DNA polymerase III subunit alpha [Candidatus Omnitrophota bacterium]
MSHVPFVHLHNHTHYSLLDGAIPIPDFVKRAVELKFPAMAITDHGNMFGAIEFYEECMDKGIKPIVGIEAYVASGSRFEKAAPGHQEHTYHLSLLVRNEQGYKNLMKLSSLAYTEGFYYKPRMDKEILREHHEGLICLSGCLASELARQVIGGQREKALETIREYQDIFGEENYYLEVHNHGLDDEATIRQVYRELSKRAGVRVVCTNDCHYLDRKGAGAHAALLCIGTGTTLDDPNRFKFDTDQFYLRSYDEMRACFENDFPDSLKHTVDIADRCNLELEFGKLHLPGYKIPQNEKGNEPYLRKLCRDGLERKLDGQISGEYQDRLEYELGIIEKMGYVSYFLIVWDLIHFARQNNIPVGPGRGSAAGSLVAYSLDITDVDPIKHGLIFERFLNPDRVTMPDIDIDFCYERRDEVIKYVEEKYGRGSVAQIITFGTMAARAAIRDLGRVMGFSYGEVDRIAKLIPPDLDMTIRKALQAEPRLKDAMTADPRIKDLIEGAQSLEGLCRHASTHAAGVVISDGPLYENCPIFKADNQYSTQYSMTALEKIGLLKMDLLGLRNLTVIQEACCLIAKGKQEKVDIRRIPFNDVKTFELLAGGRTTGVFQLESSGMRDILRKMKPDRFDHIVAILALYRPGPLGSGMVDDFIRRMYNPSLIRYDHPLVESVLKETYGVILYQEQVMSIVNRLAGFTMAQADNLRKAIGKKIPEVMEREKANFIAGARKNNVNERTAEKIWGLIEYFSGYGFNKAHSTAYAFISYQTAYLKANYPIEFMTALLSSEMDNTDKIVVYIDEAKKLGIELEPPSINKSYARFACQGNVIRFGLSAIKNVGSAAIESVVEIRDKTGPFKSFFDFCRRVDLRTINRKVLESLTRAGALDEFGFKRAQLMGMMERALSMGSEVQRDREKGQMSFFGAFDHVEDPATGAGDVPDMEEWPEHQRLAYEKAVLGFYVSSHPMARYTRMLETYATITTKKLAAESRDQQEVTIGGIIAQIKEISTKRGERMAFVTLEDLEGTCEVIAFPEFFLQNRSQLVKDNVVFIRGSVNKRDDVPKIIATELTPIQDVRERLTKVISIDLSTVGLDQDTLEKLKEIFEKHQGSTPVELNFTGPGGEHHVMKPGDDFRVEANEEFFRKIRDLLGTTAVQIMT